MEQLDTERDHLESERVSSQKSFDTSLLMLSAGEIVLSVTFVTGFEPISDKFILIVSWVLLFSSLVSQLVSHHYSIKAFDAAIDAHDARKEGRKCCGCCNNLSTASCLVDICNTLSFAFFFFGTIVFLYFVSTNL